MNQSQTILCFIRKQNWNVMWFKRSRLLKIINNKYKGLFILFIKIAFVQPQKVLLRNNAYYFLTFQEISYLLLVIYRKQRILFMMSRKINTASVLLMEGGSLILSYGVFAFIMTYTPSYNSTIIIRVLGEIILIFSSSFRGIQKRMSVNLNTIL